LNVQVILSQPLQAGLSTTNDASDFGHMLPVATTEYSAHIATLWLKWPWLLNHFSPCWVVAVLIG